LEAPISFLHFPLTIEPRAPNRDGKQILLHFDLEGLHRWILYLMPGHCLKEKSNHQLKTRHYHSVDPISEARKPMFASRDNRGLDGHLGRVSTLPGLEPSRLTNFHG